MTRTALLASLAAFVLVQGVSVVGQGSKAPVTPWGEPDLQGTWTAEAELSVPFERPREYGTRQLLSDAEFKQREMQSERQLRLRSRDGRSIDGRTSRLGNVAATTLARAQENFASNLTRDRSPGRPG